MSRILTQRLDDKIPQLGTHLRQFLHVQLLQICRRINRIDIPVFHIFFTCAHLRTHQNRLQNYNFFLNYANIKWYFA